MIARDDEIAKGHTDVLMVRDSKFSVALERLGLWPSTFQHPNHIGIRVPDSRPFFERVSLNLYKE